MTSSDAARPARMFGHPPGLFVLFFSEMWERFSYYGMRALLVFYMLKGFLRYGDQRAYAVYGAYTALVYATPFIGGVLADRVLGARRAAVIGGVMMAAGHLLMTIEAQPAFFGALGLLIVGNGFFKPNVSTMVGSLYEGDPRRKDAGFTLFYMGINLGAAMAPLLCGYVGERFGWHYGFGLATIGMLVGLAVFVAPVRLTQGLIATSAVVTAGAMFWASDGAIKWAVNGFVAVSLLVAGGIAWAALGKGRLGAEIGAPPPRAPSGAKVLLGLLFGVAVVTAALAFLVRDETAASVFLRLSGIVALVVMVVQALRGAPTERARLFVVLAMMVFSMVFWSFFEQAGTSLNNFADRNVDRVAEQRRVRPDEVGTRLRLRLNQEQLGYDFQGAPFTMDRLDAARRTGRDVVDWPVRPEHVGMGVDGVEVSASEFQSVNPICILLFGLLFSASWSWLAARGREPSTPFKFALGLLQLGLGFGALWYGSEHADARGMVGVEWLLLGYLLHTTGELCISPVGLSMVTKLSPARIASMVMGAWFMAMAFSNYLASLIARLTGVTEGGGTGRVPIPLHTVHIYGDVFGKIAWAAIAAAGILFLLAPALRRGMHAEAPET